MSTLNSLGGKEYSDTIAGQELPEHQEVAHGDSTGTQPESHAANEATSQLSSFTNSGFPNSGQQSNAEMAHVVAAIASPDGSLEAASPSGGTTEQATLASSVPVQQSTLGTGGANLQYRHAYPPMNQTHSDHSGSPPSPAAGRLNQAGRLRPSAPMPKQAENSSSETESTPSPQASPSKLPGESKSQTGPITDAKEENTADTSQKPETQRPVSQNQAQAGNQNSGTVPTQNNQGSPSTVSGENKNQTGSRVDASESHPLQDSTKQKPIQHSPIQEEARHSAEPSLNTEASMAESSESTEEASEMEDDQRPATASFNLFAGKTLGEVSNVLSEAGSLSGNSVVGSVGEGLFALGGAWQSGTAVNELLNLYNSASTPERQKELLSAGIELMRGLSSAASGASGIVGLTTGSDKANEASSATWAFSEGMNVLTQGYEAVSAGATLTPEQTVRLGQILGSGLKFAGAAMSLAKVPGDAPAIVQAVGTGFSMGSGVLNLHNKGYITSTAKQSYDKFVGMIQSARGQSKPEPVIGKLNPNAHDMV